jgi:heme exporter protein A
LKFFRHINKSSDPKNHPLWPKIDLKTKIFQLSQGTKQRIMLTFCLTKESDVWVLDEPWTALDEQAHKIFADCIKDYKNSGGCLIITHHGSLPLLIQAQEISLT